MIKKSRGRISIFGEHSDWLIEYKDKCDKIPDQIIGLAGSIDLGLEYDVSPLKEPYFKFFETCGNGMICVETSYQSIDPWGYGDTSRLLFWAIHTAVEYIENSKNGITPKEIVGCDMKITKKTLPFNKGLASSTCLISAVIEAILIVNNMHTLDLPSLVYEAESKAMPVIGGLDMIVTESPGIRLVEYKYGATNQLRYGVNTLDSENNFMKNHLAIVDIGFKAELTCNILKELQEPFHKDLLYDVKATLANLFGETTTNFSRLGEIAIKNDDPETLGILMWEFQKMYNCELGHFTRDFSPYVLDPLAKKYLSSALKYGAIYGGKCMGSHGDTAILVAIKDLEKLKDFTNKAGYNLYTL